MSPRASARDHLSRVKGPLPETKEYSLSLFLSARDTLSLSLSLPETPLLETKEYALNHCP